MPLVIDPPPSDEEQKENWKKNRRSTFIVLGLILGFLVLVISVEIMIPGTNVNQSKFEKTQFGDVSELFPKIPDDNWTITDMDVIEGENAFYDKYGIVDIESWRYYNSNIDSQLFVTIAKIDNSKNPDDYFDFAINLSSTLDEYGSALIFDENAVNSIDAEKCTAKKQAFQEGAIMFELFCQNENYVYKITSTTNETDLTEIFGIDFANQISAKIG